MNTRDGYDRNHTYLSTACLHDRHDHCQSCTAADGSPKTPGTCKWCAAPCVCECHHTPIRGHDPHEYTDHR